MALLGMVYTVLSMENKLLLDAARKQGIGLECIADSGLSLELTALQGGKAYGAILQRSISFNRSIYSTAYFESQGIDVINSLGAQRLCGDKALMSSALARAGVPTPRTFLAFTPESARQAMDGLGYPVVIKPVVGSWARMVSRLNDRDAADAVLGAREDSRHSQLKVYYLQEHVEKPGRDIRAFVVGEEVIAAVYRMAGDGQFITNTARGGRTENCPLTPELRESCLRATALLPQGVYGLDLMESARGLLVHEVNHTTEFRNSIAPTGVDIPGKIISFAAKRAKR